MNDQTELKERLRWLARTLPQEASAATEQRVLAAFRERRKRRSRWAWAYLGSAAACLTFAVSWFVTGHSSPPSHAAGAGDSYYRAMAGFTVLPYAQSDVPLEEAVIVRVELEPSELEVLGVPMAPATSGRKISADLLIGQDGVARAMRLVQ